MSKLSVKKVKDFEDTEDLQRAVEMARWLMKPLGLWPIRSPSYPTILRSFLIAVCSFLLVFMFVPSVLHIFLIEKDFKIRLRLIGPLSFTMMNLCKYYGVLRKGHDIRHCISLMAQDWQEIDNPAQREIMLKNTKMARTFMAVCAIFMYCGGLPFTFVMPMVQDAVVVDNVTIRPFAYQSYFVFFNPHVSPNFEIVYSIHCLCGIVTYTVTIAFCSITIVFILHICGQVAVTSWMLQDLADKFDTKSLGKIVKKHINALRFVSKLESILSGMCLVELFGCSFNICMLGYYFITEFEDSSFNVPFVAFMLLFISFTFNVFIFCFIGDLLTERCSNLGKIAYTVNWYQLSGKEARNLVLIVASTYRPVVITAGKLLSFSLINFTSILKVSFTYLNMLRTVTASEK